MPNSESVNSSHHFYSRVILALLIATSVLGYLGYRMIRNANRVEHRAANEKKPEVKKHIAEPLPVVHADPFSPELASILVKRLKSWDGQIRVDVTPASLEKCITIEKGCDIVRYELNGERIATSTEKPLVDATPSLTNLIMTLETSDAKYDARARQGLAPVWHIANKVLEIVPREDGGVWVGDSCYRGMLRIVDDAGIRIVNVVPLEDYIASVIDSEMPATFSPAGRQAQAIVARSYALYHILTASVGRASDVTDTTRHQRYLGYQYRGKDGRLFAGETKSGRAVAESTRGIICVHKGDVLMTYFSACCGGQCNRLRSMYQQSPSAYRRHEDRFCQHAPVYRWQVQLTDEEALAKLKAYYPSSEWPDEIHQVKKEPGLETPTYVFVDTHGKAQKISASKVARAFGEQFKSPFFDMALDGTHLHVFGEGHGHSGGLCQWGANFAGQKGKSAEEILDFYYDDIELMRLPERGE